METIPKTFTSISFRMASTASGDRIGELLWRSQFPTKRPCRPQLRAALPPTRSFLAPCDASILAHMSRSHLSRSRTTCAAAEVYDDLVQALAACAAKVLLARVPIAP